MTSSVSTGSTLVENLDIDMSTNWGRAFQISQAVIFAAKYAAEMNGSALAPVDVVYPHNETSNIAGCFYRDSNKTIYITGVVNTSYANMELPKSYASWDVIMHEYGHHVQHEKGGFSDDPNGTHFINENMADHYMTHELRNTSYVDDTNGGDGCNVPAIGNVKSAAERIAWAEAWPTVFGGMAQQYYASTNNLSSIPIVGWTIEDNPFVVGWVGDAQYDSYNGAFINYNNTYQLGDACESSIIGVLWALYDNVPKTMFSDNIAFGHTAFWNLTTNSGSKTFSQFTTYFYGLYPNLSGAFGEIVSYYKMAATKPVLTNAGSVSKTIPPQFSWTKQGGSKQFPNNSFTLNFYADNGNIIGSYSTTNNFINNISLSDWQNICELSEGNIIVAVAASQTDNPVTGPYVSARLTFANPNPYNIFISGMTAVITGVKSGVTLTGSIEIPSTIISGGTTYPIITIGPGAFANQTGVTNITISNNVTSIDEGAFSGCIGLTNVTFAANSKLTSIGSNAFSNCSSLTSMTILDSVMNIGQSAFSGCTNLTAITIPNSVISVGVNAFLNCTSLSITWEYRNSMTGIENLKQYLKQVNIPSNVTEINPLMFENCPSLSAFSVNGSNAGYISYDGVIYTKDINAQDGVGSLLIAYPSGKLTTSFTVHANANEISAYAFNNCGNLTSVNLNKVKVIRKGNFNDCENLAAVTGNSVEYVESDTFSGTAFVQNFENGSGSYLAIGNALLLYKGTDSEINVTGYYTISDGAFANNQNLVKVTIGSSVVNIGSYTFLNCSNLQTVIFEASSRMASCGEQPFDDNPNLKIIVPYCVLQDYQTGDFWKNYKNNFEVPQTLVTFNSDDGSAISGRTVSYGELIDFGNSNLKPAKNGFTFIGWKDESSGYLYTYPSAILWKNLDSTKTLKAIWVSSFEIETYTIRFISYEDNTGWIIDEYRNVAEGTTVNSAPLSAPVRDGFTFMGWYTSPNGTGDAFSPFLVLENTDFYALWQVTVMFDSALGTAVPTQYINYLDILMLPPTIELPSTSRGGFKASSWQCDGIEYDFGAPFTVTRSINFTVKWAEKTLAECWNGSVYEIYTYNQFNSIRTLASTYSTFKLMDTIVLSGSWTPIPAFYGTLDGNGYYVYNLTISTNAPSGGSYGLVAMNYGTIKNLSMWNALINITGQSNSSTTIYVGAIAGMNYGTIDNCQNTGNNTYADYYINCEKSNSGIGGIAGYNGTAGVINNCKSYLPVRGSGDMGGIVGENWFKVTNCINNNVVQYTSYSINSSTDNRHIGGVVGYQYSGSTTGCTNNSGVYYMNAKNTTNTVLQPCMGQIMGYKFGGTTGSNLLKGNMEIANLVVVGSFNQALYAGDREIGR